MDTPTTAPDDRAALARTLLEIIAGEPISVGHLEDLLAFALADLERDGRVRIEADDMLVAVVR